MPTILSRFDMIFIVKDVHDQAKDMVCLGIIWIRSKLTVDKRLRVLGLSRNGYRNCERNTKCIHDQSRASCIVGCHIVHAYQQISVARNMIK